MILWSKPCSPMFDDECQTNPPSPPCNSLGCVTLLYSQWVYYSFQLDFTTGAYLAWPWSIFPEQFLVLKFDFRSWDETANNGEGIYIDDIRFKSTCP